MDWLSFLSGRLAPDGQVYQAEWAWAALLGHTLVVLTFLAALLSSWSFFRAWAGNPLHRESWLRLGRNAFLAQITGVLLIIGLLFLCLVQHRFELFYVWSHSSKDLPVYYLISCFWEGQEGSFLLWAFWQSLLGAVVLYTERSPLRAPVMTFLALSQVFLISMLLGVHIGELKIGSSPFILLREAIPNAPIFASSAYLSLIGDGNGLNPLLQNYWMVIHPPTLFLGFASTVVPFAYALSSLVLREYNSWITRALPWVIWATLVLGAGVLMGAFWAYEALSFGGFWAWDPVENASIIPWLFLIGTLHVMLAWKHSQTSYRTVTVLCLSSFLLVLYASFLTRSGILGDASVHSFTDLGLSGQLLSFIGVFVMLALGYSVVRWKKLPTDANEEQTWSREFWLFAGALIMVLSCLQILSSTSIPVWNAIAGTQWAPPADAIAHYNRWQLPFAVLILLVSSFSLLLKFKDTPIRSWMPGLIKDLGVAVVLTGLTVYFLHIVVVAWAILVFACWFSLWVHGRVLVRKWRKASKLSAAGMAHFGFALLLLGALISMGNKQVISWNRTGIKYSQELGQEGNLENVLLWKGETLFMPPYLVSYEGDSVSGPNIYYKVKYQEVVKGGKDTLAPFYLYPNAQINERMGGLIASPDTRRYWDHDLFTHVSQVVVPDPGESEYTDPVKRTLAPGEELPLAKGRIILERLTTDVQLKDLSPKEGDLLVGAVLRIHEQGKEYEATPVYFIRGNAAFSLPVDLNPPGLRLTFEHLDPGTGKITLGISRRADSRPEYIVMKALVFPGMNLLWAGSILMILGLWLALRKRIKANRAS